MSRHESQTGSEPSTRLSVSVFAFEDPMITGTPNASQETRLGKRLPSAGGRRSTRRRGKP